MNEHDRKRERLLRRVTRADQALKRAAKRVEEAENALLEHQTPGILQAIKRAGTTTCAGCGAPWCAECDMHAVDCNCPGIHDNQE